MKLGAILWGVVGLGSAALVTAQSNNDNSTTTLPTCAITCITSNLAQTKCSLTDTSCICNDSHYSSVVEACVLKECTIREGLTAKKFTAEQCGLIPQDRGPAILKVIFSGLAIVWTFYLLRLVTRAMFQRHSLGLDDLFLTGAALCTILGGVEIAKMVHYGLGQDVWNVAFDNFDKMLVWYWLGEYTYIWYTGCVKLTLCFFFLRVFNSTHLARYIYAAIALQVAFVVTFTFVILFQCHPVSYVWKYWDGTRQGRCINTNAVSWCIAAFTITLDIVVLVLPIRELWRLTMGKMKKFYIMTMFALGFVVTIISILRLQALVNFGKTYNVTYDGAPVVYWSTLEGMFGTVALCLPTLRAFFAGFFPRWSLVQPTSTTQQYPSGGSASHSSNGSRSTTKSSHEGSRNLSLFEMLASRANLRGSARSTVDRSVASMSQHEKTSYTATTTRLSSDDCLPTTSTAPAPAPAPASAPAPAESSHPYKTRRRINRPRDVLGYFVEDFDNDGDDGGDEDEESAGTGGIMPTRHNAFPSIHRHTGNDAEADDHDLDEQELFDFVEKPPAAVYHENLV